MNSHDPFIPGAGRTINIPAGDSAALQNAVTNAIAGDTIVLQSGSTYECPITGNNRALGVPNWLGGGFVDNDVSTWVTITTSNLNQLPPRGTRVSPADAVNMPRLIVPLSPSNSPAAYTNTPVIEFDLGSHHVRLVGLNIHHHDDLGYIVPADPARPLTTIDSNAPGMLVLVSVGTYPNSPSDLPHHVIMDRCYIHANDNAHLIRCVYFNARNLFVIENSYCSGGKHDYMDAQSISSLVGTGPFYIVNNFLEGSGENFICGGGIPPEGFRGVVPADIFFARNHFYKDPKWHYFSPDFVPVSYKANGDPVWWMVKNIYEYKVGERILTEGNFFEYNWADGQFGNAFAWTFRTQSYPYNWGSASARQQMQNLWNVQRDHIFRHNICAHTNGWINLLGMDNGVNYHNFYQSGNFLIENNFFYDSNGYWDYRGSAGGTSNPTFQQFVNNNFARDITIRNNTCIDTSAAGSVLRTTAMPEVWVYDIWNGSAWQACTPGVDCVGYFPPFLAPSQYGSAVYYPVDWVTEPDTKVCSGYHFQNNIIECPFYPLWADAIPNNVQQVIDVHATDPSARVSDISNNLIIGGGSGVWHQGPGQTVHDNYFTADLSTVGFLNPDLQYGPPSNAPPFVIRYRNPPDYELSGASPYQTMGDDGGPIGVKDWPTLLAKTEGCVTGVWSTSLEYPVAPFDSILTDLPTGGPTPPDLNPPQDPPPLPSGTQSLSGTITPFSGGIGVTIQLTGLANATTTTDSVGAYIFPTLAPGSYTVTPSLAGFTYTPPSQTVNIGSVGQIADFTATPVGSGPTITSISPSSGVQGASIPVTITGTDLTGATISVSGAGVTATAVSATTTQITATLVITAGAATGTRNLTVTTAGGTSNSVSFTVTSAPTPPTTGEIVLHNVGQITDIPSALLEIDGSVDLVGSPAPQFLINGVPIGGGGASGVASLNGLQGDVGLVAGTNVTITPSGQNITISASGGGGQPQTPWAQNVDAANFWLSNVAGLGIGRTARPGTALDVVGIANFAGGYVAIQGTGSGNALAVTSGNISCDVLTSNALVAVGSVTAGGSGRLTSAALYATSNLGEWQIGTWGSNSRSVSQLDIGVANFPIIRLEGAGANSKLILPSLRTTDPGAGSKELWCDTANGNVVRFGA